MKSIWIALLGIAVLAGSASGASNGTTVDLVAYSTPKDAFGKIISAFQKTSAGSGVGFSQSYNASFDQARAVAAGQSADVVALSLDQIGRESCRERVAVAGVAGSVER